MESTLPLRVVAFGFDRILKAVELGVRELEKLRFIHEGTLPMRKFMIIGALAALTGIMSGCGLKGDLYLPEASSFLSAFF